MDAFRSVACWLFLGFTLAILQINARLAAQSTTSPGKGQEVETGARAASLWITLTAPKESWLDESVALKVKVVNRGKETSDTTKVQVGPLMQGALVEDSVTVKVAALKPGASVELPVSLTPVQTGPVVVSAWVGSRTRSLLDDAAVWYRSETVLIRYRSNTVLPGGRFLPVPPKPLSDKPRVLMTLDQVPEVMLEEPLDSSIRGRQAYLHLADTVEKIRLMNQARPDEFVQTLIKERADLAGLPFALGDACRLQGVRRQAFAGTIKQLRLTGRSGKDLAVLAEGTRERADKLRIDRETIQRADIAGLMQVLAEKDQEHGYLVDFLRQQSGLESTQALARLAIFTANEEARTQAVAALGARPAADATDILVAGLSYPWPSVAEHAASAIAKLKRADLVPQLRRMSEQPDPRVSVLRDIQGKKVHVIRELVRINHNRNCLLCHAPGSDPAVKDLTTEGNELAAALTAPIPALNVSSTYYNQERRTPEIFVRVDVSYLRQDFSLSLRTDLGTAERFDYIVRTRQLTAEEAQAHDERLRLRVALGGVSPYQQAARAALSALGASAP